MPDPRQGESRQEFITRCIPVTLNDNPEMENSQASAICHKIFDEFNKKDQLENKFAIATANVKQTLANEKELYKTIIDKSIEEVYNDAIVSIEQELSLQPRSLLDFNGNNAVKQVLKDNATTITYELFDAIEKEITLMLTDISLNNSPISDTKLKAEIRKIFESKESRLMSQIITETTRTANRAFEFGYKQSGVIAAKQWVAVLDSKTTSICRQGNGEIREIGKPFSTGDYTAPFHINCRSRIQGLTIQEASK